jgi:hypothetical protein
MFGGTKIKIKLKTCEIKIKQSLAKQDNDFKELNKFKLQRGDQPYRLQTP